MDFVFNSENFRDNHDAIAAVKNIVSSLINDFLGDQTIIEKVIISDSENFGNELGKVQTDYGTLGGYTNNDTNVACAKVVTYKGKKSSIVFVDYIFIALLNSMSESQKVDEWDIDCQLFYYVIFHELSHCYDDQARVRIYNPQNFKRSYFSRTQIKEHYICTIFSEFPACALSGRKMTHAVYLKELKDTISQIDDQLVCLELEKQKYKNNQIEIVDLAYHVEQTSWFIITQLSKAVGNSINSDRECSIGQIPDLPNAQVSIAPALSELEFALRALWKEYPNWTSHSVETISSIHELMLETIGYSFSGNDENSLSILNEI